MVEIELALDQLRWSHDSVSVRFKGDGRLVPTMLQQLLQGELQIKDIPRLEVMEAEEDSSVFYTMCGNRRLWVLKEYARIYKLDSMRIRVIQLPGKLTRELKKESPKFTTKNQGRFVTFFARSRNEGYPSMSFALAAHCGHPPNQWEVEQGKVLSRAGGKLSLPLLGAHAGVHDAAGLKTLRDKLESAPFCFNINPEDVVSLTSSLESFKHFLNLPRLGLPPMGLDPAGQTELACLPEPLGSYTSEELKELLTAHLQSASRALTVFQLQHMAGLPETAQVHGALHAFLRRQHVFKQAVGTFGHTFSLSCSDSQDSDCEALRVLLPARVAECFDFSVLACAKKLLLQAGAPVKVEVSDGWLQQHVLPPLVLNEKDLEELAERFAGRQGQDFRTIAGLPHRATLHLAEDQQIASVAVHIGRFLPGLFSFKSWGWRARHIVQESPTCLVLGPSASGKTTLLRSAVVEKAQESHVVVVDMVGHMIDLNEHQGVTYMGGASIETVKQAIEHAPRMIFGEFGDPYVALRAARLCKEAGVQMVGSLRSNLDFILTAFVHSYSGPLEAREAGCTSFPFCCSVTLSNPAEISFIPDLPAAICHKGAGRLPACAHQTALR